MFCRATNKCVIIVNLSVKLNRRKFLVNAWAGLAVVAGAGACAPNIDRRGYLPRAADLQKVQLGMSKAEVESILGSPSTTATINFSGDSYYYISSTVEQQAFFDPTVTDRKIFAVRFDQGDQVANFANYGLEDGRIIDFNTRKTPTRGKEFTILQQLFSNLGGGGPVPAPGSKF